ncbi:MAG: DEAD/DEAH box helicase [Myxococcota bacterium]
MDGSGVAGGHCPFASMGGHPYSAQMGHVTSTSPPLAHTGRAHLGATDLKGVLQRWRHDEKIWRHVVYDAESSASEAVVAPWPQTLSNTVRGALLRRGVETLFSHQVRAFDLAQQGRDFVVATPTASGKSLCYNLPILQQLVGESASCALYLFPTKALCRDQEVSLRSLLHDAGVRRRVMTYDGDTPADARRAARGEAGVLLTNPDMLHLGILPHHTSWARFLSRVHFVVLDELHTYRGVFGSHLANVLRRLQRVAQFYGSQLQFIFASATIGNPQEHASRMLGRPVELVESSGAPQSERTVLVYQPPIVDAELGVRQSYVKATVRLTADLVRAHVPTIVFGLSRNNVEVMLKYLRDRLCGDDIDPQSLVAYRGGYLAETRRGIEEGLRNGTVRCVIATNALELGIDIGALQAVVCAGYPGSIASLWQRFGRAGRRGSGSLALLVASSAPLDQYFACQPEQLFGAPIEHARIDPDNVEVLLQHLKCAAFELPFVVGDKFGDLEAEDVADGMDFLHAQGMVHAVEDTAGKRAYHWASEAYPAQQVSLRSLGWDNVVIVDQGTGRSLADMDWRSAQTMLHEHAIYQHEGLQYEVERLEQEQRRAYVRRVMPDYYTTAMVNTAVFPLQEDHRGVCDWHGGFTVEAVFGDVRVVENVVGFKKIKFHSHENIGYGEVRLPETQMHTTAVWFLFSRELISSVPVATPQVFDALHGLAYALHMVAVIALMTDPQDLGHTLVHSCGGTSAAQDETLHRGGPTLYLFDHVPGGIGLAQRLYEERQALFSRTSDLIRHCPCASGCPGCIGPSVDVDTEMSSKSIVQNILSTLGHR